jgi:hypothetical protein
MKKIILLICLIFSFYFKGNTQDISRNATSEKTIKSIVPPQLSYPSNESVISISNPIFIWIPPRPTNGMMITYSIRLVEIQNGQTPSEALLQNPPLLNLSGLTNTFLSYPANAPSLNVDGHYVWQVAASSGGQSLGVTDIASFSVNKTDTKKVEDFNYPVASKPGKERFYITHGVFQFAYNNETNEKTLKYTIRSTNKKDTLRGLPKLKLHPGINKLQVDLKLAGLKNASYYYLEIEDKNRQAYKLMYYYLEP